MSQTICTTDLTDAELAILRLWLPSVMLPLLRVFKQTGKGACAFGARDAPPTASTVEGIHEIERYSYLSVLNWSRSRDVRRWGTTMKALFVCNANSRGAQVELVRAEPALR